MEDARDPTLGGVLAARRDVYRFVRPTPLHTYAGLDALLSARVFVKHENHLPTGAFKVRGGLHLAAGLDADARRRGLYTASTGNHGQSIAFAGRAYGVPVRIAVPEGANPVKVAAMEALGARVVLHGRDFDEAREWIQARAASEGARFVGPTDPELIEGVATYVLEILEDLPDVEAVVVPIGAGSGACGCCLVGKTLLPDLAVFGVQSASAPAQQRSWAARRPVAAAMETRAEGLATRVPFANAHRILGHPERGLDDFVLVEDAELDEAVRLLLAHTRNLAEHAGAAALAGALRLRERLAGRRVALVLSGGNLPLEALRALLRG